MDDAEELRKRCHELEKYLREFIDFKPIVKGSTLHQGNFRNWLADAERLLQTVVSE